MRTKLDLAILPIGDNFTMDIEDAIVALTLSNDKVLGYHYDTFGYIEMIIKQPFKSFPIKEKICVLKWKASNYKHDLGFDTICM
jgi:hypothetical protein